MKTKLAVILGVVGMLAAASVQATSITGSIALGGYANLNSQDTTVTSWPFVYVEGDSGSFGSVSAYSIVNMTSSSWVFSPTPGQALSDAWTVGGFTFNFLTDTVVQNGNFLDLTGTGTISAAGYSTTTFNWTLAAETPVSGGSAEFTFAATAGAPAGGTPVPDGGLTVALLGLALAGVEGLRRALIKA
ncbi:MAG TPA: VPDSG-CTERM sorting domain-containing protein [Candidatus Sulfotelmatobacter sp.]|nr:VPDSG-CTERM sorting domain-containing protein [Candidatus Sulfotelmatobacter sp.]